MSSDTHTSSDKRIHQRIWRRHNWRGHRQQASAPVAEHQQQRPAVPGYVPRCLWLQQQRRQAFKDVLLATSRHRDRWQGCHRQLSQLLRQARVQCAEAFHCRSHVEGKTGRHFGGCTRTVRSRPLLFQSMLAVICRWWLCFGAAGSPTGTACAAIRYCAAGVQPACQQMRARLFVNRIIVQHIEIKLGRWKSTGTARRGCCDIVWHRGRVHQEHRARHCDCRRTTAITTACTPVRFPMWPGMSRLLVI